MIGYGLLTVLALSGFVAPLSLTESSDRLNEALKRLEHEDRHPMYTQFCQNNQCIEINVNTVRTLYPQLLVHTVKVVRPWSVFAFGKRRSVTSNSDSDVCCPTARSFDNPKNMKNVHGVKREIYQTTEFSQLIPIGSCLPGGSCGDCIVKTRTMSILVVDFQQKRFPPVEFDQFHIPIYCTCSDKASLNSLNVESGYARADRKERVDPGNVAKCKISS